jgi:hypothetical protein
MENIFRSIRLFALGSKAGASGLGDIPVFRDILLSKQSFFSMDKIL